VTRARAALAWGVTRARAELAPGAPVSVAPADCELEATPPVGGARSVQALVVAEVALVAEVPRVRTEAHGTVAEAWGHEGPQAPRVAVGPMAVVAEVPLAVPVTPGIGAPGYPPGELPLRAAHRKGSGLLRRGRPAAGHRRAGGTGLRLDATDHLFHGVTDPQVAGKLKRRTM